MQVYNLSISCKFVLCFLRLLLVFRQLCLLVLYAVYTLLSVTLQYLSEVAHTQIYLRDRFLSKISMASQPRSVSLRKSS